MKQKIKNLLISIILIGFFTGCINKDNENKPGNSEFEYFYNAEIKMNGNGIYTVLIPIPIYVNGSTSNIINDIIFLSGKGNYNLIQTNNGIGLNISASGDIILNSNGTYMGEFLYDVLSMQNISKYDNKYKMYGMDLEYYTYGIYDKNISKLNVNIKCRSGGRYSEIDSIIENVGWQTVTGIEQTVVP